LIIRSANTYVKAERKTHVFLGFFYGITGLMLIGVFYVWLFKRERIYLYFMFAILAFLFYSFATDDILPDWVLFQKPGMFLHLMTSFISVTLVLYVVFAEHFFSPTDDHPPFVSRIFMVLKVVGIMCTILYFIFYYTGNKLMYFLIPLTMLSLMFISLYFWINGIVHARFFFWATFIPLLVSVLISLITAGVFQSYLISQYAIKVGNLAQVVVFLAAMGDRYFILQRNFTGALEEKVQERTSELENALKQLKSAQQHLVQSEKMASLGTLTAGISHEINNPLNYISGGLYLLDEHSDNSDKDKVVTETRHMESALSMIREGFEKTFNIVRSLLSFSSGEESERSLEDIHVIFDNTLLFLKSKIGDDIALIRDYQLERLVPVYQDKLHQIFLAIIDNAIFALRHSGQDNDKQIRISTRKQTLTSTSKDKSDSGELAVIEISNNGGPIPEDHLGQIFDPFFTTKDPGVGVGLGLSIVYTLVSEHDGEIKASNSENGISFVIELPLKSG